MLILDEGIPARLVCSRTDVQGLVEVCWGVLSLRKVHNSQMAPQTASSVNPAVQQIPKPVRPPSTTLGGRTGQRLNSCTPKPQLMHPPTEPQPSITHYTPASQPPIKPLHPCPARACSYWLKRTN
jgi:hypothetical protein